MVWHINCIRKHLWQAVAFGWNHYCKCISVNGSKVEDVQKIQRWNKEAFVINMHPSRIIKMGMTPDSFLSASQLIFHYVLSAHQCNKLFHQVFQWPGTEYAYKWVLWCEWRWSGKTFQLMITILLLALDSRARSSCISFVIIIIERELWYSSQTRQNCICMRKVNYMNESGLDSLN